MRMPSLIIVILILSCLYVGISIVSETVLAQPSNISSTLDDQNIDYPDFLNYENPNHGIKIGYLSNWEVDKIDDYPADGITEIVTFWSPNETPDDAYQEYFQVNTYNLESIPFNTLSAVLNQSLSQRILPYQLML